MRRPAPRWATPRGVPTHGSPRAPDSFALTAPNAPSRPLLFDESGEPKPAYDAVVHELPAPARGALALTALSSLPALRGRWLRSGSGA